jgi:hypothetical protein
LVAVPGFLFWQSRLSQVDHPEATKQQDVNVGSEVVGVNPCAASDWVTSSYCSNHEAQMSTLQLVAAAADLNRCAGRVATHVHA